MGRESLLMKLLTCVAKFRGEVRAHANQEEIDERMRRQVFQNPVQVARVGAGGGNDGNFAWLHALLQQYFGPGEIDIPRGRV